MCVHSGCCSVCAWGSVPTRMAAYPASQSCPEDPSGWSSVPARMATLGLQRTQRHSPRGTVCLQTSAAPHRSCGASKESAARDDDVRVSAGGATAPSERHELRAGREEEEGAQGACNTPALSRNRRIAAHPSPRPPDSCAVNTPFSPHACPFAYVVHRVDRDSVWRVCHRPGLLVVGPHLCCTRLLQARHLQHRVAWEHQPGAGAEAKKGGRGLGGRATRRAQRIFCPDDAGRQTLELAANGLRHGLVRLRIDAHSTAGAVAFSPAHMPLSASRQPSPWSAHEHKPRVHALLAHLRRLQVRAEASLVVGSHAIGDGAESHGGGVAGRP
eukprot:363994-Chlamydomonas_euryale.AAC.9